MSKLCIKVKVDAGGFMPTKAYASDAGFDIFTPTDLKVYREEIVDTCVHMQIPDGYVGFIKSKSGLAMNRHIHSDAGVVDAGYSGSIAVKLVNYGNTPQVFKRGEKIAQIVLLPIPDAELVETVSLDDSERGANGFGSTGA